MEFRGLTLDRFQVEAIEHLDAGKSVVVSAATGTGKTIIADYVIDRSFKQGRKVFYTSPIKALSNQKFSEFKRLYGEHAVGILTGDVVINPQAPLLIMTTEIYRNMLLVRDPIVNDVSAIVFDEIHYLGDYERGTAWEEALIFSPPHVRFLCLSATIPNARQFAHWIERIQHHEVAVVTERKRAVPLEHGFFDNRYGLSTLADVRTRQTQGKYPSYKELHRNRRQKPQPVRKLTHLDLIRALQERAWIPCIYFCFSRKSTMEKAVQLAERTNFLLSDEERAVRAYLKEELRAMDPAIAQLETTRNLARCLARGIAFHHAGLLPRLKEVVEKVFERNLLRVLYATETFAVGINLPAKAVCFDSLEKYDGTSFRYLHSKEYFQLAGRAGRRGMDAVGYAISYLDPEFADLRMIERITAGDDEPLESQYKLSYNTILNLVANHTPEEREVILRSSFYTYQAAGGKGEVIVQQYAKKVALLERLGFLKDGACTAKGDFARRVYQHELVLTELFMTELVEQFSDAQIALLCAGLEFEPRPNVQFKRRPTPATKDVLEKFTPYPKIKRFFQERKLFLIEPMLCTWLDGGEFTALLGLTTMPEGDIIRFFRRVIDVLQQVQHASPDERLRQRIQGILASIDRDIVEVRL